MSRNGRAGESVVAYDPVCISNRLGAIDGTSNVLAVLFETNADAWYRRWRCDVDWEPAQFGLVETYELHRGAATTAPKTTLVADGLAVTRVERSASPGTFLDVMERYLDEWNGESTSLVYLESVLSLIPESGSTAVLETVLDRASSVGADVYARLDSESVRPSTVVRLRTHFDREVGVPAIDADASAAIEQLRIDDPTNFGYVQRYWSEAMAGIEATGRTFPQAKQVHAAIPNPETTPRTLGATLKALEMVGVIGLWGETVGPNRYDLRSYDPDRLAAIGLALEQIE